MLQHLIGPLMTARQVGQQGMMNPGSLTQMAQGAVPMPGGGAKMPMAGPAGGGLLSALLLLSSMKR